MPVMEPSRFTMYALLSGMPMTNYLIRGALPSLVPLIAEPQGWSENQIAVLLSAFYPGYLLTQIPSGWAAQRFGGKFMLTMNMAGSALSLMVAPRMARQGFWSLVACFFVMGACQGPLMPAKTAMQQTWLPKGVERVWATRFMSLGTRMAQLAAVAITPRIVTSYGWQWVPHIYGSVTGAVMLVWQLFAADAPSAIRETGDGEKNGKTDSAAKTVEWRIFQVKSAQSIIASHIAWNNSNNTVDQWAPIYYAEMFGLTPVAIGTYLSAPLAISSAVGNGLAAAAETFLQTRGMDLLQIRKVLSWVACGTQAGSLVLFALARSPIGATAGYFGLRLGQCFHGSGANASYLEVGGNDTAILMAVGNTLASFPATVTPFLALWLKRLTGSWIPLFSLAAAVQLLAAVMYGKHISLNAARDELVATHEVRNPTF